MVIEVVDATFRARGMAPIGALQEGPPFSPVAKIDRTRRRSEDQRARVQHMRQRTGVMPGIRRYLSERNMAGRLHEFLELPIGDRGAVDQEWIDCDAMNRGFFRIVFVGSHAKGAARN